MKVSDSNVFGIRVGVSINLFVKKKDKPSEGARIFYHRTDEGWNRKQKFEFLKACEHIGNHIAWQLIEPDKRHTWLTEGLRPEFEDFVPIGTKAAKAAKGEPMGVIFKTYSGGVKTNRDAWAYNLNRIALAENISRMIEAYNEHVLKWEHQANRDASVDDFVDYNDKQIKWSSGLKQRLKSGQIAVFTEAKI